MTENEKYLFERIRNGDEAAFKVIFNSFYSLLYYFIVNIFPTTIWLKTWFRIHF